MSMLWSNVFLPTVLFFSSISFDNAAQDMRIKGGVIVPDFYFGSFSILLNYILNLNHHYHLCTYFVFQKGGILLFPFMNANGFYHTSLYVVAQSSQKIQVKNNDLPQSKTFACFDLVRAQLLRFETWLRIIKLCNYSNPFRCTFLEKEKTCAD